MCGIVGVAAVQRTPDREWLEGAGAAIAHRGPDDHGSWWSDDGAVGLGHQRLAIVDLSTAGHQPMIDPHSGSVLVFNGEIYNFREIRAELEALGCRFQSRSDTEVVLQAYRTWGPGFLARLDGMFAFALLDRPGGKLLLARDRAGEKPLFYRLADGELRFASELKALLVDPGMPRRIDSRAFDCFLSMGYIPGNLCIFEGYSKLQAGHALTFDLRDGSLATRRYWSVPEYGPRPVQDEAVLVEQLERLLEGSISRQLVADVPVGVLLSGGLDSSLITALAARNRTHVKTFTIRFPGHGKFDETEHARLIARHFGTDHVELEAEEGTADLIPLLARQIDEPMADSSAIPTYLVSKLVRQHCTVALGGDGGDELFGGYGYYPKLLAFQASTSWLPHPLGKLLAAATSNMLPPGMGGGNLRAWLLALGTDLEIEPPLIGSFFDPAARRRLMRQQYPWPIVAETIRRQGCPPGGDLIQKATRQDFAQYLAEDILVKVDRMSMLNSLELRAPFLDRAVIEFAMRDVPTALKVGGGQRKILLKRLASRLLPESFDTNRKQGFSIPLDDWLHGTTFRKLFEDVLLDANATFDRSYVEGLLAGQLAGRSNGERLFALVMFETWQKHYGAHF